MKWSDLTQSIFCVSLYVVKGSEAEALHVQGAGDDPFGAVPLLQDPFEIPRDPFAPVLKDPFEVDPALKDPFEVPKDPFEIPRDPFAPVLKDPFEVDPALKDPFEIPRDPFAPVLKDPFEVDPALKDPFEVPKDPFEKDPLQNGQDSQVPQKSCMRSVGALYLEQMTLSSLRLCCHQDKVAHESLMKDFKSIVDSAFNLLEQYCTKGDIAPGSNRVSFPFLSETDLEVRWADSIPAANETSYMLLMALCAVSAQSLTLKAVFDIALLVDVYTHDSNTYFDEAVSHIPARVPDSHDLDYLRTFGLLAVYSLRNGNKSDLHRYLGLCHALIAQHGFQNESYWDCSTSLAEVDNRRRLFWCVYRLEIHSACVMGHIIHLPEAQISVQYPRITPTMKRETQAWTAGWDYITDLFRLMEYAILNLRQQNQTKAVFSTFRNHPSPNALLESLHQLKAGKPFILRFLSQPHDELQSNRCKYMKVQITCTEALVNIMALLHCHAPVSDVIKVAEDFLNEISEASLIMFKVASSQIIQQLLGVGHMVYNAFLYDEHQCQVAVGRLVSYLEDIVKNLEQDIPTATAAREELQKLARCIA
ncbi:c6 transcription factor [Fusarium longipes]|uniref:C6 transcription factor n=1 Tax=Fusarium longipes TaxID=694270 RepID=A0A395T8K8_9HYPO|nr:c6 transcription factor [Fusarium longipes]